MLFKLSRIAIAIAIGVVLTATQCRAQVDTESHRRLERGRMGTSALQMRLELMQRLQQIAKDRQQRGQPPLDLKRLPKNVRDQIEKIQQQDDELRKQLDQAQKGTRSDGSPQPNDSASPAPPSSDRSQRQNRDDKGSRRIDPSDPRSMGKALQDFQEWQRQRSKRSGSPRSSNPQSNPGDQRGSNREDGNPSERPLFPNDGFDISKYLDRLGASKQNSKSGKATRSNRGRSKASKSGNAEPQSKGGKKPNLRKLWKQATEAGKVKSGQPKNRVQLSGEGVGQEPKLPAGSPPSPNSRTPAGGKAPGSSDIGEGVFGDALRRTLDGSAEYIGDLAKNYRKPQGGEQPAPRRRGGGGLLRDMGRKTGELFGGSNGPQTGRGSSLSMPEAPSPTSLLPFAIGLALIGIAWFFMRTLGGSSPSPVLVGSVPPSMPPQIDSRQDVIDAFHYIASESPAVQGNWWTHSRVARALRKFMPQRDDAVAELTRVYETARYLPPDEKLTPQQLQSARAAVERCKP
ncbi:MAG: DUF4129 domain-containing protein [Planctomycetaceae bacterium]